VFPANAANTAGQNFINFDSTSFGRVTLQRGTSRQMNIIAQLRF
jgi:hypothetical protein